MMTKTASADPRVVAIGASQGGLTALHTLLGRLPADYPLALLVVQHRTPDGDHLLAASLRAACALPVLEPARVGKHFLAPPGAIYLAPAGRHLLAEAHHFLRLSAAAPVFAARPSIDLLFHSAARTYRRNLLAVLLTGLGRDGSDGLRHVSAVGGVAIVQDPCEAEAPAMPRNGLQAAPSALALPLAEIGRYLLDWAQAEPADQRQPTASRRQA